MKHQPSTSASRPFDGVIGRRTILLLPGCEPRAASTLPGSCPARRPLPQNLARRDPAVATATSVGLCDDGMARPPAAPIIACAA
jgi:hypothetical protein